MQKKIKESHCRTVGLALQELSNCSEFLKANQRNETDVVQSIRLLLQVSKRARGHIVACQNLGISSDNVSRKTLLDKHQHLQHFVRHQVDQQLEQWTSRMNTIALEKKLFFIDADGRVQSGADVNMAKMICECNHLQKTLESAIPVTWETWITIYECVRMKMKLVDIIVSCCNGVEAALTPSVRDLLEPRLKSIKQELGVLNGNETCNWKTQDPEIIEKLKIMAETALRLHQSMKKFQSTSEAVEHMAHSWSKMSLIEYQEGLLPTGELLSEQLNKKYQEFAAVSKKIGTTVNEAQQLMSDLQPPNWFTYLKMIDALILDGIVKNIKTTYSYFQEHGIKTFIYDLQLIISVEEGIRFNPPLDCPETNMGILQQFSSLVIGITRIASFMNSLSGAVQFQQEIDSNASITSMQEELISKISGSVIAMTKSVQNMDQYRFLWETDPDVFLYSFIQNGCFLGEKVPDYNNSANPALLKDYKDQLEKISQLKNNACSTIKDLEKGGKSLKLRLNVKPAIEVRQMHN